MTKEMINLTCSDSMIVDSFEEEINLSMKDKLRLAKKTLDNQFKKRLKEYICGLNSLDIEEIESRLEDLKNIYISEVIKPTLIELLTNSKDKNLHTSLRLDLYDISLDDVYKLQVLTNTISSFPNRQDELVNGFANLIFSYVKHQIALKRKKILDNIEF